MNANDRAAVLAKELEGFLCLRAPCPGIAYLALCKLIGQRAATMPDAPGVLNAGFHAAQDEMRLRIIGTELHAAGLGGIMPVQPA